MYEAQAKTKYIRISPRKARLAAALIRGLNVKQAQTQLQFCGLKAGPLLMKTLNSAIANALEQHDAREEEMIVTEVRVDDGPTLKRAKPKNRGGRHQILKRTSHFLVKVSAGA